jgi:hypothetical protein
MEFLGNLARVIGKVDGPVAVGPFIDPASGNRIRHERKSQNEREAEYARCHPNPPVNMCT